MEGENALSTRSESPQFVDVAARADVGEGRMLAVEVDGERILLTEVEGALYAIGAVCTHERAYLDQGTIMGHQVFCPRHFSCFDVRTGEALAPPADRATPAYAVRVEGDRVLVSRTPLDPEQLQAALGEDGESPPDNVLLGVAEAPASRVPTDAVEEKPLSNAAPARRAVEEEAAARAVSHGQPTEGVRPAPPPAGTLPERLIEIGERLAWLESASESLGAALRPLRESRNGGRVFDVLHGRVLGHALHPALSDLPIGLWAGALLLDALGEDRAAGILGAGGVAAGVATATTGVADWTVSDGRDRRLGLLHGIAQVAALVGQVGSLAARRRGARPAARVLMAGSFALSAGSAYLGGHLVFGRGVMVDHTAWTTGPRSWTRALAVEEVPEGGARTVEVAGRPVLLARTDGVLSALEGICTHAGGPLSLGRIADGVIACPWHGSCFRLRDGAALKGPAARSQPTLDVRLRDGWVEVRGRRR